MCQILSWSKLQRLRAQLQWTSWRRHFPSLARARAARCPANTTSPLAARMQIYAELAFGLAGIAIKVDVDCRRRRVVFLKSK